MQTILLIEDEQKIARFVELELSHEGYEVIKAEDGRKGLELAEKGGWDLLLLDIMLPGLNGLEVLRRLRKSSDLPVIMLTARDAVMDKVTGLDMGADDYITKPFSMHELAARVRAVLRRVEKQNAGQGLVFHRGEISLDQPKRLVKVNDRRVDLTPSEFDILAALMAEPGRVFSRQELLDRLQGGLVYDGFERMINVHISNLRNKIEPDPSSPHYIETVYGAGYRFNS